MQKIKKIITNLVFIACVIFLLSPPVLQINFNLEQALSSSQDSDVIIVFIPGGWGDTPIEKSDDFLPILEGVQNTLDNWGYRSIVIPYNRTVGSLKGRIVSTKDFLSSFDFSSEILAQDIESLVESFPDKKIILAGLSNGAGVVNQTYKKISSEKKDYIFGISAGSPFWINDPDSENILQINNEGRDTLTGGEIKSLLLAIIKTPFVWLDLKFKGENIPFTKAFLAPGHKYSWESSEVNGQIVTFLKEKIR